MFAVQQPTVDWTQVLVVGLPLLIAQMATVVIAVLNHHRSSDAATKADQAKVAARASADQIAEVHRQTKPRNGRTLAATVESVQRDVQEVRREQGALARQLGAHLADHGGEA